MSRPALFIRISILDSNFISKFKDFGKKSVGEGGGRGKVPIQTTLPGVGVREVGGGQDSG